MSLRFPSELLVPKAGELKATIFENRRVGIARGLFFGFAIEFEHILIAGRDEEPYLSCDFLSLDVGDWRSLAGQEFGAQPAQSVGDSDCTIYVDSVHNPVELRALHFGEPDGDTISVHLSLDANFVQEGTPYANAEFEIDAVLRYGGILICPDIVKPKTRNAAAARAAAERFISLAGHGVPVFDGPWTLIPFQESL